MAKEKGFPENRYVNPQDIPLYNMGEPIMKGWQRSFVGVVLAVIVTSLLVCILLLFFLPSLTKGAEDQSWTPGQAKIIEELCTLMESQPERRDVDVDSIMVMFGIPGNDEQKVGVYITLTLKNGSAELMTVYENMPVPKEP